MRSNHPLLVVGAINAYTAILAQKTGFKALYLSGAGVANASLGLPDIGLTRLQDVLQDARRIVTSTSLPLLVDVDTGWNNPERAVREMIKAGVAAVHIEDQVEAKRCGHLPHKRLVPTTVMIKRIKAAVAGRTDPAFVIMARTDAAASEGIQAAIHRACEYRDAGADIIFAEALTELKQYREFADAVRVPVLANITEFGKTPLFTAKELAAAKVRLVLFPLSAFRAMSAAALRVYRTIMDYGTQERALRSMQTRDELYQFLDYHPGP